MFCVIRNGQYLETEIKLFGDLEVPQKPHEKAFFQNGIWIIDADKLFREIDEKEARDFLNNTDWKVIRHREQLELGIETSLSAEEYLSLIIERQNKRSILNDIINEDLSALDSRE